MNQKTLTKAQALAKGYTMCGDSKEDGYQHLSTISDLNKVDFEETEYLLAGIEPSITASISEETIAEIIAEHVICNIESEVADDDLDDVEKTIKALDFSATAKMVNDAICHKQYYSLTDIKLIFE